jgi:phosphodiesterase/alkaline phosphatase D-like protein
MLYRSLMIGAEIQVIVLDLRKSLSLSSLCYDYLGKEQAEWLQFTLEQSQATWKIIASGKTFGLTQQSEQLLLRCLRM